MSDGESYKGSERRQAERFELSLPCRYEAKSGLLEGEVVDISLRGCFILADARVEPGETVKIELGKPGRECIRLFGEVVYRTEEIGFALRFSYFQFEDDRKKLELLLMAETLRAKRKSKKKSFPF